MKLTSWLCAAFTLSACQVVTKLDSLMITGASADAAVDAATSTDAGATGTTIGAVRMHDAGQRCVIADGAECELVRQCGCAEGQHCQARTHELRARCVKPGSNAPWSGCNAAEDCPMGQTCDRGSCRPYCQNDDACNGGRCIAVGQATDPSESGPRVCWKSCDPKDKTVCAPGTSCRSMKLPDGAVGTFCVAPLDPCPTANDGRCDDSHGNGSCADGTDVKDCSCKPTLTGAPCDPIAQCGCAPGYSCSTQKIDSSLSDDNVLTLSAACSKAGTKLMYEECRATEDCAQGLQCNLGLRMCVKVCTSDSVCGDGACSRVPNRDDPRIGVCEPRCDRKTGKPCLSGTVCATFSDVVLAIKTPGDYCWPPVGKDCPVDGVCDEPQGTGLCTAGADPQDCCKLTHGECDHVTGCGCANKPDTQCRHTPLTNATSCQPKGSAPPWTACSALEDPCSPGYVCGERACRKYCSTAADCGKGAQCFMFLDLSDKLIQGIGACFEPCDFDDPHCPGDLVCAKRTGEQSFCMVPYPTCPDSRLNNGLCDDPRGTRFCAMGTDPECE